MEKIGWLGAGKVACSLGKYLKENGLAISGYYSKSKESADKAATFTDTKSYDDLTQWAEDSSILMITTPDDEIRGVWNELYRKCPSQLEDKIVCHCSGSLSSDLFEHAGDVKAHPASIHPVYAFSDRFTTYLQLQNIFFTLEGDAVAKERLNQIFASLPNRIIPIETRNKGKYHAALSLLSNSMIALYRVGTDLLKDCGEGNWAEAVEPLVRGNFENLLDKGVVEALTGPVERGDVKTVEKHRKALKDCEMADRVYADLGEVLIKIAREKHPERDYTSMAQMMKTRNNKVSKMETERTTL